MNTINERAAFCLCVSICVVFANIGCKAKTTLKTTSPSAITDMGTRDRDMTTDLKSDQGVQDSGYPIEPDEPDPEPQPPITCPDTQGAQMLPAPGGYYCIDVTEVTRGQYQDWIDTAPTTDDQPSECTWNTEFTPTCSWPAGNNRDLPVSCVDWCDAKAYCKSVNKRLCGKISGGPAQLKAYDNPRQSEWFAACSSGGKFAYGPGDTLTDPTTCRGEDGKTWGTTKVGINTNCQSPVDGYRGVFDLSGNAMEWVNACDNNEGGNDRCRVRGGSYNTPVDQLRCDTGKYMLFSRASTAHGVSFRCCAGE